MRYSRQYWIYGLLFFPFFLPAQSTHGLVAKYDFNDGAARNEAGKEQPKAVGVLFGDDRFGNPRSACFLNGNSQSYLNLGTGPELKPATGSISIWVNILLGNFSGNGYHVNPIIITKCCPGDDFFEGYDVGINLENKKIGACCTYSPEKQISVYDVGNQPLYATWHHIVVTYDDDSLKLYVDGVLQNAAAKGFRTKFLDGDSVMVGNSANRKNNRFLAGYVDDIRIYNRVITPQEVAELFEQPDPNRWRAWLRTGAYVFTGAALIYLIVTLITRRLKKEIERQKEQNRQQLQVFEMEMKVVKAQMNPHFIFNSMNSIQQFILADDTANANTYLVKFSRLLRKILESNTDEYISVANEVDILGKYLELEGLRFARAFSYEIITDPSMTETTVRIPQMLIQPLVENAIWHGLLPKAGSKKLEIRLERIGEKLLSCTIDDNGVGRKSRPKKDLQQEKSLGIHFIRQRLELMRREWGGQYALEIVDKTGDHGESEGTRVILTLPIIPN